MIPTSRQYFSLPMPELDNILCMPSHIYYFLPLHILQTILSFILDGVCPFVSISIASTTVLSATLQYSYLLLGLMGCVLYFTIFLKHFT